VLIAYIDTATNTVIATIPVGSYAEDVAVSPDSRHAYIANAVSNTVSVIDTANNTVTATIPVGQDPLGVAITRRPPCLRRQLQRRHCLGDRYRHRLRA